MLKELSGFVTELGVLATAILVLYNIVKQQVNHIQMNKNSKSLLAKIEESDTKQTKDIEEIKGTVSDILKHIGNKPYAEDLKKKIHLVVTKSLEKRTINNELYSYFILGRDAMCDIVDNLMFNDFLNLKKEFSLDLLRLEIISKMKSIKKQIDFDKTTSKKDLTEMLKPIILSNIDVLIMELNIIRSGQFNGESKNKLECLVIDVIKNTINDTIEVFKNAK